jgi:hypothetical protein
MERIGTVLARRIAAMRVNARLRLLLDPWRRRDGLVRFGGSGPLRVDVFEQPDVRLFVDARTADDSEAAMEALCHAYAAWVPVRDDNRRRVLAALLPTEGPKRSSKKSAPARADDARLALATALFRCTSCHDRPIPTSEALIHHCGTGSLDEDHPQYYIWTSYPNHCCPWNLDSRLQFHAPASAAAADIVAAIGLDPAVATHDDLADVGIVCTMCKQQFGMSWLSSVSAQKMYERRDLCACLDRTCSLAARPYRCVQDMTVHKTMTSFCVHPVKESDEVVRLEHSGSGGLPVLSISNIQCHILFGQFMRDIFRHARPRARTR